MEDQEYVQQLEETIGKFLEPLNDIPFSIFVKATTGHHVLGFDPKSESADAELLDLLKAAGRKAGETARDRGIFTDRPNEAGNKMEPFVREGLELVGLSWESPRRRSGRRGGGGYPDIAIKDAHGRLTYLECKTYAARTRRQTFRTFYTSPSQDPKVNADARHLLIAFELRAATIRGRGGRIPVSWAVYSLDGLRGQIKHEFNADNTQVYRGEALLASGRLE